VKVKLFHIDNCSFWVSDSTNRFERFGGKFLSFRNKIAWVFESRSFKDKSCSSTISLSLTHTQHAGNLHYFAI